MGIIIQLVDAYLGIICLSFIFVFGFIDLDVIAGRIYGKLLYSQVNV